MKNLNDVLTVVSLIAIVLISIRFFIYSLIGGEENIPGFSRIELLRNYCDNEED